MKKLSSFILKIFLLLGFSLLLCLIILEVVANKLLKKTGLGQKAKYTEDKFKEEVHIIGSFDAYLGWGYAPNTSEKYRTSDFYVDYSINAKGFRDKEILLDKPLGEFRIVALGESTVFGQGINYGRRFTEIIENSLEDVEVINMGVWGFGSDQSLLQLERDGLRFKPNAVILFVIQDFFERCKTYQRLQAIKPRFVLNNNKDDIILQGMDFIKDKFFTNIPPEIPQQHSDNSLKRLLPSFFERSSLFALLSSKKKILVGQEMIANIERSRWRSIDKQVAQNMQKGIAYNDRDFERFIFLMLKRYQKICKDNSMDFILVYIDADGGYFLKYFVASCRDLGIKYLDLSDTLFKASNTRPLRFNVDPHYNEFTHQVIGEYASEYLAKEHNLVRKKGSHF